MRAVEERAVDASGADARGDVEWPAGQDQVLRAPRRMPNREI